MIAKTGQKKTKSTSKENRDELQTAQPELPKKQNRSSHLDDQERKKNKRRTRSQGKKSSKKQSQPVNQQEKKQALEDPTNTVTKNNEQLVHAKLPKYNIQAVNSIHKQTKLNHFIRKKNQNGESISLQTTSKFAPPQADLKKNMLQQELKKKDLQIQRLKTDMQSFAGRYNKLFWESNDAKMKSKHILLSSMRQTAQFRRKQKAEINPKLGYFKVGTWTVFVQGEYIKNANKRLESIQSDIEQLQERKKYSVNKEEKDRLISQIQHLKKDKAGAQQIVNNRQKELNLYKNRLKLSQKQSNCYFALQNWSVVNDRYLPMQLLGSGGFGQVYKCFDSQTMASVALKMNCFQPNGKNIDFKDQFIRHVKRQVQILKVLDHPNIAKLIDEIQIQNNKVSFILEYCSGPELSHYLKSNICLQEKQARGIIKQISFALKYMFEQRHRVIHYDLKPSNIIFHNGVVKIIDFGLCKKMDSQQTRIQLTSQGVGTYWYLPPETFSQNPQISSKVDVWSLGVIFYQMLYGKRPFGHGINQNKIFNQGIILKAYKVDFPVQNQKKYKVSQQAKSFITQCLKYAAEQRLDPEQVYNHPYLN